MKNVKWIDMYLTLLLPYRRAFISQVHLDTGETIVAKGLTPFQVTKEVDQPLTQRPYSHLQGIL